MRCLILMVALSWSGLAVAGEKSFRQHSVQAGIGNQYGWLGGSYLYRFDETWSAGAGIGVYGYALHGRISPVESYKPLYFQLGYSPVVVNLVDDYVNVEDDDFILIWYGPDISVGIDTKYKAFSFTAGVGYGQGILNVLGTRMTQSAMTIAIGVGINFG